MKNKTFKILLLLVALVMMHSSLRADDFTDAILKAKKNLQTAMNNYDEKALIKVRGEFERILQLKKHDWIVNYYLALCDFGMSYSSMRGEKQDKEKLKKHTESALLLLEKSILVRDDFADAWILKLSLNFNRWIYEQDRMNDIMSVSNEAKTKAETLDPNNPRLWLVNGISTYYMPENFGGGAGKSVKELEKSLDLFQTRIEKEEYYPDWGKDMAYGYLTVAYAKRGDEGDKEKAQQTYDKGLLLFPESGFLKGFVKKQLEEINK